MERLVMAALAGWLCGMATAVQAQYAPGERVEAYLGGRDWKSCTVVRHRAKQGDYEVRCGDEADTRQVADDADHIRFAPAAKGVPNTGPAPAVRSQPIPPTAQADAGPPPATPTQGGAYAPGDRVDAYLGGRDWQSCTVVKHNVRQGDYEVRCDGKPDTSRVAEDADHIRPATEAVRAAAVRTNARQAALRQPGPDIDANLRPVTLRPGGRPLSGIYLQLKPMMGNAALGRTSFDYFTFWPDGRVCEMLPIAGADPADHDAMQKDKPRLCGRYVFTSSKLTIDVPDNVKIFDYEVANFDGTNFVMNGYPTVKVQDYGNGAVLNCRYTGTRLFPTTFRMDLALSSNGMFDLVETPRSGGPVRHLQGRYRLFGNTLDLGSEKHTIHPLEGGKPGRLVLDGYDLDPA